MSASTPLVTVVVAGRDDVHALRASVESLLGTSDVALEVLVVAGDGDGGGGDAVDALAPLRDGRLVVVPCGDLPVGARVNVGIALARAPFTKLVLRAGVRAAGEALARDAALLARLPRCTALFSTSEAGPEPSDASPLVADLLARRVPCASTALIRTAALRALGGVDATLDAALAYDLWLRLLPGSEVAQMEARDGGPAACVPLADEGERERAEHGFVLARAVHGQLERWAGVVARADGSDERDAWLGLAVRLLRADLGEAAPLAREAYRAARRAGHDLPSFDALAHLGPEGHATRAGGPEGHATRAAASAGALPLVDEPAPDETPPEPLAGGAAVRELADAILRTARGRRALDEAHATLRATTERLAYDVALTRRATDETAPLAGRALDKLRLGRRIAGLYRGALARWRSKPDADARR